MVDMDVASWTTGDSHSAGINASAQTEVPTSTIVLRMVIWLTGDVPRSKTLPASSASVLCNEFRIGSRFIHPPFSAATCCPPAEAGLVPSRGGAYKVRGVWWDDNLCIFFSFSSYERTNFQQLMIGLRCQHGSNFLKIQIRVTNVLIESFDVTIRSYWLNLMMFFFLNENGETYAAVDSRHKWA